MLLSGVWIMQEVEEIDSEAARRKSHLERGGGKEGAGNSKQSSFHTRAKGRTGQTFLTDGPQWVLNWEQMDGVFW